MVHRGREVQGIHENAGPRWDKTVGVVASFVTSGWALYPLVGLAGFVGVPNDENQKLRDENAQLKLAPPPQQADPRLDASVRKQNLETFLSAFDASIPRISRYYDTMMEGFTTLPNRLASAERSDLPSVRRGPLKIDQNRVRHRFGRTDQPSQTVLR